MSPLAKALYKILVKRLRAGVRSLTYGELVEALPDPLATHRRSRTLHTTLGAISVKCRENGLPCLPAMVWRADTERPGPTYYVYAHPNHRTEPAKTTAWKKEHARLLSAADEFPRAPWAT